MNRTSTASPKHCAEVRSIAFEVLSVAGRSSSIEVALDALLSAYVTTADGSGCLDKVPQAFEAVLSFIRAEQSERAAPKQSHQVH